MKQTNEIKAVEMVRKIRDSISKELAHKSPDEIMEFFNRAGNRAKKSLRTPKPRATAQKYPAGWDEGRVRQVRDYYDSQTDEAAAAEIEASSPTIMMEVPSALVPAIRRLIARRMPGSARKTNRTTLRAPVRTRGKTKAQKITGK
jgi:hypothetical protein